MAVGSCHTGGSFLFLTGAAEGSFGEPRVEDLRHRLFSAGFFLDAGRTSGLSSSSSLMHELDMLFFALTWQRLHGLFG